MSLWAKHRNSDDDIVVGYLKEGVLISSFKFTNESTGLARILSQLRVTTDQSFEFALGVTLQSLASCTNFPTDHSLFKRSGNLS